MAQFLGFGDGRDGELVVSGNTTDTPVDSAVTATGGTDTGTVDAGLSLSAGDIVGLFQMQGSGVGTWEQAQVESYSSTTVVFTTNLVNSYSGKAQLIKLKQYQSVTVQSGFTLTAKAWNGTVGGILFFLCNGVTTVVGSLSATSCGFRGGSANSNSNDRGSTGEGTVGASVVAQKTANGNGGGGGQAGTGDGLGIGGGGGGGEAAAGGATSGADGGNAVGDVTLSELFLGGGGGGFAHDNTASVGTAGGGIIGIFSADLTVTGSITSGSANSSLSSSSPEPAGSGGTGSGGSILIKTKTAIRGSGLITANPGTPAAGTSTGGTGSVGRIRTEACQISGTTSPTSSDVEGGHDWCISSGFVNY